MIELRNFTGQVFLTVENHFDDFNLSCHSAIKGGYEPGPTLHIGRPAEKSFVQKIDISTVGAHCLDGIEWLQWPSWIHKRVACRGRIDQCHAVQGPVTFDNHRGGRLVDRTPIDLAGTKRPVTGDAGYARGHRQGMR